MGKIIAICNQKGGVGKTTTCVNLAAALGILEKKVLVIDTDPQANATISFGCKALQLNNPALEYMNFISIIKNNKIETKSPNVDLLPFIKDFDLFKEINQNSRFKKALQALKNTYDYIFIDCVPFFKTKNLEILISSDAVIIPIQCDYYALEGLHKFLKTFKHIKDTLNPDIEVEGFLLTMFDKRVNLSKMVALFMQSYFKSLVFKTIIFRNIKLAQAPGFGKSIFQFDATANGARDYLQLASELIDKNTEVNKNEFKQDVPILSLNQEKKINKKTFNFHDENKNASQIIETKFKNTKPSKELIIPVSKVNFNDFLGQEKTEISKIIGIGKNNFESAIWVFKTTGKSFLLRKKFLFLYFENNILVNYTYRRFKKAISFSEKNYFNIF